MQELSVQNWAKSRKFLVQPASPRPASLSTLEFQAQTWPVCLQSQVQTIQIYLHQSKNQILRLKGLSHGWMHQHESAYIELQAQNQLAWEHVPVDQHVISMNS